jgi:magnesium-protoporphyrin O-methyltransferase
MFKARTARRDLKRHRKHGLGALERRMTGSISADDLGGARVLEIGGGIGAIQAELLAAGASRGEIIELVAAYEPYAHELARDKGVASRSVFRVTDVLGQPGAVEPATIVVLNRVVCCSPEGVRLAGAAARLTERVLLVSFPRARWFVRALARVINGTQQLIGRSFRVFIHQKAALYAAVQAEGLQPSGTGRNLAWEFAMFRRARA